MSFTTEKMESTVVSWNNPDFFSQQTYCSANLGIYWVRKLNVPGFFSSGILLTLSLLSEERERAN